MNSGQVLVAELLPQDPFLREGLGLTTQEVALAFQQTKVPFRKSRFRVKISSHGAIGVVNFSRGNAWQQAGHYPTLQWTDLALCVLVDWNSVGAVPAIERCHVMPSNITQNQHVLDYSQRPPRGRRRWPWIVGALLVFGVIGSVIAYVVVPAYSIHKQRELNIQAGILNAAPAKADLVGEWNPTAAGGKQAWQNWTQGPNAYDSVDAKATVYPILRAGMLDGTERRAVLVWFDTERVDGFDIEYAVIEPGSRFSASRLVNSGTQAFNGASSQQPIRVWSATFLDGDRSRFVFDFEIAGVRQSAEATLAGANLSFKTRPATNPQ